LCHASNRGYQLDFLTKLSHKLGLFPSPKYHSVHHQHLDKNGKKSSKINCVSCNLYNNGYKNSTMELDNCKKLAHHCNWAAFLPYASNILEYIYLNLLDGPTSIIGYRFVMFLSIISYPAFTPLWLPFIL